MIEKFSSGTIDPKQTIITIFINNNQCFLFINYFINKCLTPYLQFVGHLTTAVVFCDAMQGEGNSFLFSIEGADLILGVTKER